MSASHPHDLPVTFCRAPGGAFTLESALWLPRPRDELFPFFSAAENLGKITPPMLGWRIITPLPVVMREGALIEYRIAVHGLPMRWRSLISAWEPPVRFVDEQVKGPYRLWRHEHRFESVDGGTLCRDRIEYSVPFAFLTHRWIVQPDLLRIFTYRQQRMRELFSPDHIHHRLRKYRQIARGPGTDLKLERMIANWTAPNTISACIHPQGPQDIT